jgi:glycosyltransferase involved in cell wall biosynthesis
VIIRKDAHIPTEVSKCCLEASSEEDMADKIYELLTNTTLRRSVIDEGLEYSQQFTWERTAHETLRVYEEVMPQT